ncbi:ABC transporter permease [Micromonospora sp. HM134]|uniref:ABC transporter permease n=1 Tax=unclassified Micromonospora TaxID=2617518 RepID=UPI0011989930|nr:MULTISPECIES: ABC transporter permease [unclassified Micromonospora]QDY08308.1 ABC transporter permease [Micromonospora sp. HM134]
MTPLTGARPHRRPAPPVPAPAPRLGPGAGGRAVLALLRRDLGERRMLRLPLLLDLVFGAVNLLVFLFISRLFSAPQAQRLPGATTYFDFVAVGITFMLVLQAASTQLTSRVAREQRSGTLELLAAQPVPAYALAVGTAAYPFLLALLRAGVYLLLLHTLLGLHTGRADWWGVAVVLVAGSAAMMGIGIGLTAFAVAAGHGEAVARLLVVGVSFLSGTYFPVAVLPGVLPPLTAVLPSRIALDGLRAALAGDAWGTSALTLLAAALLLLPLSTWVFGRALRVATARGTLTRD